MPARQLDMAVHVQSFVNSVRDLPTELQRCFAGIRERDQQCQTLKEDVDKAALEELHRLASQANQNNMEQQDGEDHADVQEKLLTQISKAIDLSEEKVAMAQQMYDYVDNRIREFDKNMQSFDAELMAERARLGISEPPMIASAPDTLPRRGRGARAQTDGRRRGNRTAASDAGGAGPPPLGLVESGDVDGEEPLYCYCRRVSYGDMIACDSDDCRIEWFHYACVGIDPAHPPRGKWYCNECSAARRGKGK